MENGRTQNASPAEIDNPGEELSGGGNSQGQSNSTSSQNNSLNNDNNNNNHNNNIAPFPPAYPCSEGCIQCGQKILDPNINEEGHPEILETQADCSCECHQQSHNQPSLKMTMQQMHTPPGGPNCLQGCGYSGLPCYNCSSFESNSQQQESTAAHNVSQGFPTQIYTVELINPNSLVNLQSQGISSEHRIYLQSEDSPDARKRRRTCISLVVFIITINVAIAVFRILSGSNAAYG